MVIYLIRRPGRADISVNTKKEVWAIVKRLINDVDSPVTVTRLEVDVEERGDTRTKVYRLPAAA